MLIAYGVWVSMAYPPRKDRWAIYVIEAQDEVEGMTTALQWASFRQNITMPVECELLEIMEI